MANLLINDRDVQRLREFALREGRSVEEVVSQMIEMYAERRDTDKIQDQPDNEIGNYLPKLYAHARAYWRSVNDAERLSLTDEQLKEQFWCIDPEGIPRLKSDQDKITLPEDGLLTMAFNAEREGLTDVEEMIDYRKILNEEFPKYLWDRMHRDDKPTTD